MKSLRAQLILSHVLPQLIVLPLLLISLAYLIESQVLLAELEENFSRVAMLTAQELPGNPAIWQDASQAEYFARLLSASQQLEVILFKPDGEIQAAPLGDVAELARLPQKILPGCWLGKR